MKGILLILFFYACHGHSQINPVVRSNIESGSYRGISNNSPYYAPSAYYGDYSNQSLPYGRYPNSFNGGGYGRDYYSDGGMQRGGGFHSFGGESHHRGGCNRR